MTATLPAVIREYLDACDALDAGRIVACVTDDVCFEHVSNGRTSIGVSGVPAFRALVDDATAAFLHRRQRVRDAVVAGDRVAVEIDLEAVVKTPETPVRVSGVSFFTLRDGKIAALREFA